jgi:Conserved in the green lineage and diatoms 27
MYKCPVPKEQRPINEYMELVQSNFFKWPFFTESLYKRKIFNAFLFCFSVCFPISCLFFNINKSLNKLIIVNSIACTFLILLLFVRLLLGWIYIKERLENPTVFYEESGWYDGRIWVKSKNILIQECLIRKYQVLPAIKRLKDTLLLACCFLILLILFSLFS